MFKIAIIGKPNVGKSTLFNKLSGRKIAIVDDFSGITRDRKYADACLGDMRFELIDTAGIEEQFEKKSIEESMIYQSKIAINEADLCLFMVNGKDGLSEDDFMVAKTLQKVSKDVILLVNKKENNTGEVFEKEFYRLGFGAGLAISSEHKEGFALLYEKIEPFYQKYQDKFQDITAQLSENIKDNKALQLAIIGRPNAGKSTFINNLIQENRLITGEKPGVTRDSITINWEFNGQRIKIIDTAGIRKKANITEKIEKFSLESSFRELRFAQVVVLMIDAKIGLDKQDLSIASMVISEGRGIIFAINKIDLIKDKKTYLKEIKAMIAKTAPQVYGAPITEISALNGTNITKILRDALNVFRQWQSYIRTAKLNKWLQLTIAENPPMLAKGKPVKVKYVTQAKKNPPTFTIFTNYPDKIRGSYERFLMNSLRNDFNLKLTPIRMIIKKSENPFEGIKYKTFSKKTHS